MAEVLMRIPFIVKPPGGNVRGMREQSLVNLVDIAPTCLAALPPAAKRAGEGARG